MGNYNSLLKSKAKRQVEIQWEDDSNEAEEYPEKQRGSHHLKSADLRSNIMRVQKNRDPLYYYEIISVLGVGSMGSVSKVRKRKRAVGGSAREENVASLKRNGGSCFELPLLGSAIQFCSERSGISELSQSHHPDLLVMQNDNRGSSHGTLQSGGSSYEVYYALKSIHLNRVTDATFIEELKNEIEILKSLDHPHIVRPIETFEHRNQLYMVMELCAGGDLYTRDPYTEEEAARIISSVLSAVSYMHEHNIVHRDLKYENILFVNDSPQAEVKLIDFGLSTKYVATDAPLSEGVGTIYCMSPDVLKSSYGPQCDLWSVGVITFMLLSSQMPFYGRKRRHIIDKIMKCKYEFKGRRWAQVSSQAKRFVSDLLVLDPNERATAEEAACSTWLNRRFAATVRNLHLEEMETVQTSLKAYSDYSKMKRLALMVIAHKSTSEEIGILRKAFQQYDKEKRGVITFQEFKEGLAQYGYSDKDLENMFDGVDLDGTGKIRYTEFLAATIEGRGTITEERLAEAFDRLDSDDSGYISAENLREILGDDLPQVDIDDIIREVDLTKDNQISYHEFLACFEDKNAEKKDRLLRDLGSTLSSESGNACAELLTPLDQNSRKRSLTQLANGGNALARANFIERKKLSERRASTAKHAKIPTPPSLDYDIAGPSALKVS